MATGEFIRSRGTTKNLALQVLASRWFMFFACLLIMSASGATYMFGIYSSDIKHAFGYDQTTLNLISFFKDIGTNIGVISGVVNEILPLWMVLTIGSLMNFSGYFLIWLAVTGRIAKPQVWQVCLYICIGANSQTFSNTGVLVTCVKNFPESRGMVIGLLKGFTGLSGAIITQLYHAFYGNDSKALILLIAWLPAAVSLVFLSTVRRMKGSSQEDEMKMLYNFLYLSLGMAGLIMIIIILQNQITFTRAGYAVSAGIVLIMLFTPLAIVISEEFKVWKGKKTGIDLSPLKGVGVDPPPIVVGDQELESTQRIVVANQELESTQPPPQHVPWWKDVFNPPERGNDYSIPQALFSLDLIILFAAITLGAGGILTAIDNLGQIGKALGYPQKNITTFVTLMSIWNFLGKVSSGFTSEILLSKYKFPRPLMLSIILLISCLGHLLIALGIPGSLYIASIITGFCFGAQWPLNFAIISEIFGLKHYSTLQSLAGAASPLGAYILNVRITGSLYDKEAMKQMAAKGIIRKKGEELICTGVTCYRVAFFIMTGSTLIGAVVSLILVIRTRKFYKGDIYKKFREQGSAD